MQYLSLEDVIAFYTAAIGTPLLRNPDGLGSAIGRPQQSAFGQDAYPTLSLKAAALMQSLAENQPFLDGNKRIAWISTKIFLQVNGASIEATSDEAVSLFNRIATGLSVEDVAHWIHEHIHPIELDSV